jgi:hypothetical protein
MKFIVVLAVIFLVSCNNEKSQKISIEDIVIEEDITKKIDDKNIKNNYITIMDNNTVYESYIFDNELFINISDNPEVYKNNDTFIFNEYFPHSINKGTPQKYIEVENDEIKIIYYPNDFSINGKYIIQFVTIKKCTNKYCFGDLFGKTTEEIIAIFSDTEPEFRDGEISYTSEGYIKFVVFEIKNNIVYRIQYGENI